MTETEYKLNILKDICRFSRVKYSKEEMEWIVSSALFRSKTHLTAAALLVKKGDIDMTDFVNLASLEAEELDLYLEVGDDDFNYFAKPTPEEVMKLFTAMDEYIQNHPEEALLNRKKHAEQINKIKGLTQKEKAPNR